MSIALVFADQKSEEVLKKFVSEVQNPPKDDVCIFVRTQISLPVTHCHFLKIKIHDNTGADSGCLGGKRVDPTCMKMEGAGPGCMGGKYS